MCSLSQRLLLSDIKKITINCKLTEFGRLNPLISVQEGNSSQDHCKKDMFHKVFLIMNKLLKVNIFVFQLT